MPNDTKYGDVSGPGLLHVPHDEPIFILRAQDLGSVEALLAYKYFIARHGIMSVSAPLEDTIAQFQRFHAEHPDRTKFPD